MVVVVVMVEIIVTVRSGGAHGRRLRMAARGGEWCVEVNGDDGNGMRRW